MVIVNAVKGNISML